MLQSMNLMQSDGDVDCRGCERKAGLQIGLLPEPGRKQSRGGPGSQFLNRAVDSIGTAAGAREVGSAVESGFWKTEGRSGVGGGNPMERREWQLKKGETRSQLEGTKCPVSARLRFPGRSACDWPEPR
jgi:hypothetical protein